MASPVSRTYLRQPRDAVELLGKLIRLGRKERKMNEEDLSGRAGISRRTLKKIERGDPKCKDWPGVRGCSHSRCETLQ